MIAELLYIICAITSFACAWLLFRGYYRSGARLLLWTGICFITFFLNNVMLFVDLVLMPDFDLSLLRLIIGLVGALVLLYGLVWEEVC